MSQPAKIAWIQICVCLFLLAGCSSTPTSPANEAWYEGKWRVRFDGTGAVQPPQGTFTFKQTGDSLSGTFVRPGKNPVAIEQGIVRGDSLFFRMRTNLTADAPRYLYILKGWRQKGTENIEGTWWYTRGHGSWIATRP